MMAVMSGSREPLTNSEERQGGGCRVQMARALEAAVPPPRPAAAAASSVEAAEAMLFLPPAVQGWHRGRGLVLLLWLLNAAAAAGQAEAWPRRRCKGSSRCCSGQWRRNPLRSWQRLAAAAAAAADESRVGPSLLFSGGGGRLENEAPEDPEPPPPGGHRVDAAAAPPRAPFSALAPGLAPRAGPAGAGEGGPALERERLASEVAPGSFSSSQATGLRQGEALRAEGCPRGSFLSRLSPQSGTPARPAAAGLWLRARAPPPLQTAIMAAAAAAASETGGPREGGRGSGAGEGGSKKREQQQREAKGKKASATAARLEGSLRHR